MCSEQESAVREIRTLRLTWRGLETSPRWNCAPIPQSKERHWKPSTYSRRACPRPYRWGDWSSNRRSYPDTCLPTASAPASLPLPATGERQRSAAVHLMEALQKAFVILLTLQCVSSSASHH